MRIQLHTSSRSMGANSGSGRIIMTKIQLSGLEEPTNRAFGLGAQTDNFADREDCIS